MTSLPVPSCADEFSVPNLDAILDPEELDALSTAFGRLAAYADNRARGIRLRLAGDIECALSFERCCDAHYRRLPEWARW